MREGAERAQRFRRARQPVAREVELCQPRERKRAKLERVDAVGTQPEHGQIGERRPCTAAVGRGPGAELRGRESDEGVVREVEELEGGEHRAKEGGEAREAVARELEPDQAAQREHVWWQRGDGVRAEVKGAQPWREPSAVEGARRELVARKVERGERGAERRLACELERGCVGMSERVAARVELAHGPEARDAIACAQRRLRACRQPIEAEAREVQTRVARV